MNTHPLDGLRGLVRMHKLFIKSTTISKHVAFSTMRIFAKVSDKTTENYVSILGFVEVKQITGFTSSPSNTIQSFPQHFT